LNILQAIILGILQGATEFIPVSSSAHLVLVPWALGWPEPGLAFDTVLHLGTLTAVLVVLRDDWLSLLRAMWRQIVLRQGERSQVSLAVWLIIGTVPAAIMGILWEDQFEALFHSPKSVAALLIVTGLWLALVERLGHKTRPLADMNPLKAVLIGIAQGCAIAPGISRSGATIGAALLLGFRREVAARFSFLLSAPIILGAGLLQLKQLMDEPSVQVPLWPLVLGFLAALVSGYVCIRFLLSFVKTRSLSVFAAYCCIVGLGVMLSQMVLA